MQLFNFCNRQNFMKAQSIRVLFALLAAIFSASATGRAPGSDAPLSEDDYFSDLPVVLSASRLPQSLRDAPGSMTILDRETIKRTGARDLADLLRWVPGFQVAQPSLSMAAPVATYHGLWPGSSTAMQLMVDGRTYYSPLWFGGINFDSLPLSLENIERIEILRGANSATYGSNAISGVINIITTEAALARGTLVSFSAGNQGVADVFARTAGGDGNLTHRLSVARQQDHGLDWFRDSRQVTKFDARFDWRLSNQDEMRFMASGVKTLRGNGYRPETSSQPERDNDLRSLHFQTDWTRQLAADSTLSLRYFHVRESIREAYLRILALPRDLFDPSASGNITLLGVSDPKVVRNDIELQHSLRLDKSKRVVWGFNWRNDSFSSQYLLYPPGNVSVSTKRLFGHFEWRLAEQWLLNAGGTWENESLSGTTFSPRLTMSYQPSQEQTIRFGVSRSHRSPSIAEQRMRTAYSDPTLPSFSPMVFGFYAVGNVQPEQLDSFEIGYLGDFRSLGLNVDVRLFDERRKKRVVDSPMPLPADACALCAFPGGNLPYTFINAQNVRIRGLEYQLRWKTPWSAQIWFNQTFGRIKSERLNHPSVTVPSADEDFLIRGAENSMPRRAESIHWMQDLPWGGANLTVSYSHARPMQWIQSIVGTTHRVDWRLAVPFRNAIGKGEIAWIARAATGSLEEYRTGTERYQQYTISPRHWITLQLQF